MYENIFKDLYTIIKTIAHYFDFSLQDIVVVILILLLFWLFFISTRRVFRHVLVKANFNETLIRIIIQNIYQVLLFVIGLTLALKQLGFNIGAALASFGIVGVAVGFAAQEALSNIIAGFVIFLDQPFKIGQWVTVAGQYGKVHDVTLRSTRIRTINNTYVVIPNTKVINEVLVNHSRKGKTRIDARVGIAYKENIDTARNILLESVSTIEKVLQTPIPEVVVESLGDFSINLVVQAWIEDAEDEIVVHFEMVEKIKKALDTAHIEIPYPHLQIITEK